MVVISHGRWAGGRVLAIAIARTVSGTIGRRIRRHLVLR